jgi:hypothetical protein
LFFYQILTAFNNLKIVPELVLPLPNTYSFQQFWRFLSEFVLLLLNTDSFEQFEDFVRAYSTSTKYWQLSTIWRFCQSLFYFYQILTDLKNMKIFVRACSTSTKYWPPATIWRFLSELVLLLLNTDSYQQFWRFLSEFVLLLLNTDSFQQFEDFVRAYSSIKYWQLSRIWRLCQSLFYFYQILTDFNNMKIFVRACSTSTKYWPPGTIWRFLSELVLLLLNTVPPSTIWRFLSELILLLLNTDHFQQFGDLWQNLFYFYQILTAFNNLEIFVRSCSTKYWQLSTMWRFCQSFFYQIRTAFNNLKILSELVLLRNTDSFGQFEDFCQS